MRVYFASSELALSCNDDAERLRTFGPQLAPILLRRLCEIASAGHLAALRLMPAARLRDDPGDERGGLLITLRRGADLRVRPGEDPAPTLLDGRLDESRVKELLVTEVAVA